MASLALKKWHKGSNPPSVRNLTEDEESMISDHWSDTTVGWVT